MMNSNTDYNDCHVYIEGQLSAMPILKSDDCGECEILLARKDHVENRFENYRIIIRESESQRILQEGYAGMLLAIYADLRIRGEIEIVAEKIYFITYQNSTPREKMIIKFSADQYSAVINQKNNRTTAPYYH